MTQKTIIVAVAIVLALLCCCCCSFFFFLALQDPAVMDGYGYDYESLAVPTRQAGETPVRQYHAHPTLLPKISNDEAPVGGLGDDVLRKDIWRAILSLTPCNDVVSPGDVSIVVDDEHSGLAEHWIFYCQDGHPEMYSVVYVESASGGVDYFISQID